MDKTLKIMLVVGASLWLACLVLGCLTSTGHVDWKVETKEQVECADAEADARGI